jgi:flagellar M-ring protein FliF
MAETGQAGTVEIQKAGQGSVAGGGAGSTAAEKALAMVDGLRERVMALPASKRNWLLAAVAFLLAICAGMAWFAGRTDWKVLFSGLDGKDVQQVSQELAVGCGNSV